ncbi:MAG: ABC transporter permease [Spirochaetaceae bacterium]|nr:MAG: ABC transporter permease [Spirochaetaceae bacterium]
MRRLASLVRQDLILAWRNGHIVVVLAIAALMIALIVFLPEKIASGPGEYVLDEIPGAPVRAAVLRLGGDASSLPRTREEYETLLESRPNTIGIEISGSLDDPVVQIVTRTSAPEQTMNLLVASIEQVLRDARGEQPAEPPVEFLRPQAPVVPLNLSGIPIFLAFEVGILGFLLVAVFVFGEKQEATIRAYRVSPGGLWPYIVSKAIVFVLISIVYGVLVVAAGLGFAVDWLSILALVVWASLFMTIFGLGFAAWFRNLSHWFFPGLAVLVLNLLPFVSYVYPVWSPAWVTFVPSYALVYALREALFPTGNRELIVQTLATGSAWLCAAVVFCALSVRARLLKGA